LLTITASLLVPEKLRNFENTWRMPARLPAMSASVRILRLSSRPEGSPTRVVPPPISAIGLWPVCCIQ
jgi:hypothetical protein